LLNLRYIQIHKCCLSRKSKIWNMASNIDLNEMDSRLAGNYRINANMRPIEGRVGWTHFSLYLEDGKGGITSAAKRDGVFAPAPVIEGIHSRGGKGIMSWIEVECYTPDIHLYDKSSGPRLLELGGTETERALMRMLAGKVAPGGHMMFAYETVRGNAFHRETLESLLGNIPPVCTPLGKLLFDSGFRLVKDWYLAEGGFEGPRKLWGEKPADDAVLRQFDGRTLFRVLAYCSAMPRSDLIDLEMAARKRAGQVLSRLLLKQPLSALAKRVARLYRDCGDKEAVETAARRTCGLVASLCPFIAGEGFEIDELRRIAGECAD